MTIAIIIIVLSILVVIAVLIIIKQIKDKKSLQFKVDFAEKQFEQVNENIKNYKLIIEKLNKKKVESEEVKNNISNASGRDLAILANSL